MSEENVLLHRRTIDAFERRDLEAALALMDEDVKVVSRIVAVEGRLRGHDGIRRWWDNWAQAFPNYRSKVVEIRDFDDVTIATIRGVGHGGASAVPFEDNTWQACRWREDKCIWWQVFRDEAEALRVAGLSE